MSDIHSLSNEALICRLDALIGSQREITARLIGYLAEIEDRRLQLAAGYSSMFEFCTSRLRMSEGEAFRRITAARLVKAFPVIVGLIESGALHLSGLAMLREHLTADNHVELLGAASGKSKRAIEALVATRFPKPDVPARIRKLPATKPVPVPVPAPGPVSVSAPGPVSAPAPQPVVPAARPAPGPAPTLVLDPDPPAPAVPAPPARQARIEPLSESRYKVQFTASQALKDKLDRVRDLLSHANPRCDLAVIVERAVDNLIAELERKKRGKAKCPRPAVARQDATVTRSARREVFEREGQRCGFVSPDGRRCTETAFLEIDHEHERARGGSGKLKNLRVRCRAHNRWLAEQTFGKEHVERKIHLRQRRQRKCSTESERARPDERSDKLLRGLTALGFTRGEARKAIEQLRSGGGPVAWDAPIEALLRAATQILT
jgi:hypothetical protein